MFNGGFTTAECTVRDLSADGARLDLSGPIAVPSEFILYVNPERQGRPARVAWRDGTRLGIAFTGPAEASSKPKPFARRRRDEGY